MNTYMFKTKATMKDYNRGKYWVDSDYIREEGIEKANTVTKALESYINYINREYYDIVSKSALKNRQKMYIDTKEGAKQIGYVVTGCIDIDNKRQYIDLWIEVKKIEDAFE